MQEQQYNFEFVSSRLETASPSSSRGTYSSFQSPRALCQKALHGWRSQVQYNRLRTAGQQRIFNRKRELMKSLLNNSRDTCTVDMATMAIISPVKFVDQTDATLSSEDVSSPQRTTINSDMASTRTTLQHTPSVDQSPLHNEEAHSNLFETREMGTNHS